MGLCSGRYAGGVRLDGKTAIVTGCNTGIGKYTAQDFYKRGCRVIMACRDVSKAEVAKKEIETDSLGQNTKSPSTDVGELIVLPLDLSSLDSVRKFADTILNNEPKIHLLINNAGIMMCPKSKTVDGIELQFGTNHLGHFLLTILLLPRIITSAPARIVNLSSLAHIYAGNIDWEDMNAVNAIHSYNSVTQYARSKLANIHFTKELARRLKGSGVTVYALHPGVVNTELARHVDHFVFPGAAWMYRNLLGVFQKDEQQGAATTLYCALDQKTEAQSGLYYSDMKLKDPHAQANDQAKAAKLWTVSLKMANVDPNYDPFHAVNSR